MRLMTLLTAPVRMIEAIESVAEAAGHLGPMRSELALLREQTAPLADLMPEVERIREQIAPVRELMPALERLREQTEPLAEILPALERLEEGLGARLDGVHDVVVALEGNESHLNKTTRDLVRELSALHATLSDLQDDVQRITDRVPDPDARGPIQKARDVLTTGAS